jgi:hypothetical protein
VVHQDAAQQEGKRQTDIYLVSLEQEVASNRQTTFSGDKNETSPKWSSVTCDVPATLR